MSFVYSIHLSFAMCDQNNSCGLTERRAAANASRNVRILGKCTDPTWAIENEIFRHSKAKRFYTEIHLNNRIMF